MHELPHELGDFIVYKKLGLKTRQALALNFIAALVRKGFLTHSVLKMSRQWSSDFSAQWFIVHESYSPVILNDPVRKHYWSFIGLYTGLALATETEASSWLLALVAGLFTYIPMVDIVSFSIGASRTRQLIEFLDAWDEIRKEYRR